MLFLLIKKCNTQSMRKLQKFDDLLKNTWPYTLKYQVFPKQAQLCHKQKEINKYEN